ncbi:MAG: BfmA/BtgA family mobilization protein, partial [Bacteroidota bacterium]
DFGTKNPRNPKNYRKFWHKTMKKKRYTYHYANINLRREVTERFRAFSKKVAPSHAETLTAMMDFFEWHNYSPYQRFGKDILADNQKTRKRIDAVIAIIKDIEKSQNIPLINIETMLQALFEGNLKRERPKPPPIKIQKENTKEQHKVSHLEWERLQQKQQETREQLSHVLDKVELVKNRFGNDYLKLNITREELARFKRTLNK